VNLESERMDKSQLEGLSTTELVKHALSEVKLLARAEVLHAKREFKDELKAARTSAILLGAGAVLALVSLGALVVALGLALPLSPALGVLVAGVFFLLVAGALAFFGIKHLPKAAMPHTQARLKNDFSLTKEALV